MTLIWDGKDDDDTSDAIDISGYGRDNFILMARSPTAAWDSGVLTVQVSPDGSGYCPLLDPNGDAVTLSADGAYPFTAQGNALKIVLASVAGAAADIDVWLVH
jgi:hypothetical protein